MKLTWVKWSALPLAVLVSAAGATVVRAQDATPATDAEEKPTIEQRKENQQDRIANGVKSEQLTAAETANLEKQAAAKISRTASPRASRADSSPRVKRPSWKNSSKASTSKLPRIARRMAAH